ncbi:MAG: HPr family phosphocarrier protein [Christensenellales bacterium]
MQRKEVHITGPLPMTRERVIRLVGLANTFSSHILLEGENLTINGKSMLGLLSINRDMGRDFFLVAQGEDELEARDSMIRLLEDEGA